MIIIVLGMSKSGTTLTAKTLHESGFNMHPKRTGNYKQSKYEDQWAVKILLEMVNAPYLKSLYLPKKINVNDKIIADIKRFIHVRDVGNWGIKQPYLTLTYHIWKDYLPEHKVIAIKRSPAGLLSHWQKRKKKVNGYRVMKVQKLYNSIIDDLNIPVITFENFLLQGPVILQKALGLKQKLKDVRV
jgi:hypothetical protein